MNPYTVKPRELLTWLYRRFVILLGKALSRKGAVLALSTVLLCRGIISETVWQFLTAVIIVNIGGIDIAQYLKPKDF